ncbi:hypothetical protein [Euzebya tangerina]|uniref:hypothetical protein n=1 Tax=Euzebya tangerina TaxID=591198 RepID=UPI000E30DCF4|nr:hypothetical protein [Euzebya tangerina]
MTHAAWTVDLADLPVRISAADADLHRCASWHFGALPRSSAERVLQVELVRRPPAVPGRPPDHVDGPVQLWRDTGRLHLAHVSGGRATADDHVVLVGGNPPDDQLWKMVRQLLFSSLSWVLGRRDRLALHAAMASRADQTVLLLGPTGTGKSTIAVALCAAGWSLHADDLIIVERPDSGPATAVGMPKRMAIASDLASMAGDTLPVTGPLPGDHRGRLMVAGDVFATGRRAVTGLIVAAHDEGDGRMEPLPHHHRLSVLTSSYLDAHDPDSLRRGLPHLAGLARLPGWRLGLAADPARRLTRASAAIESALESRAGQQAGQ